MLLFILIFFFFFIIFKIVLFLFVFVFFFKQKTAYEMLSGDWSSDVLFRSPEGAAQRLRERVQIALLGDVRAEAIRADVAEQGDLDALAETLRRTFGHVDVWVNNAGADILTGDAARLSRTEKLDRLLAVDLRGTVLASWKAVEVMDAHPPASGGVILNMSWDHVLGGGIKSDYAQVFCAAKGGVYSFSRALAHSVAPRIRVNVLGPGWIETAYGSGLDPAVKQRIAAKIPLGRWGTPEDIAHAAVYLASDVAAYVTGQMLMINGGGVV